MDRKEFLKALWNTFFKLLLLLGVLFFSVRFFINIFLRNDIERLVALIVVAFVIFTSLSYFIGLLFKNTIAQIKSRLSDKFLQPLKIIGNLFDYVSPIALGIVIYYSWLEDRSFAIGFFGVFLILQIIEIVKNNTKRSV